MQSHHFHCAETLPKQSYLPGLTTIPIATLPLNPPPSPVMFPMMPYPLMFTQASNSPPQRSPSPLLFTQASNSPLDPAGYSYVTIGAEGAMTYLGPVPPTLVGHTVMTDNTNFDINIEEPAKAAPFAHECGSQMNRLGSAEAQGKRSRSRSVESASSDAPRRRVSRSKSQNRSLASLDDVARERSNESSESIASMSKRDLINNALATFADRFGPNYDQNGNRGENVLRIKVKTRTALEHIVAFVTLLDERGLLSKISCPISTKKGRQHIRGFLAYLETTNTEEVKRLFYEYNAAHTEGECAPFKDIEENPPSKRPYNGPM